MDHEDPVVAPEEELLRGLKRLLFEWDEAAGQVVLALRAYYRRPEDTQGLSVERRRFYPAPEAAMRPLFVGMASITAAEVVGVAPDELRIVRKERSAGANIVGLPPSPLMEEATPEQAERATELAAKLCHRSRIVLAPDPKAVDSARRRSLGV
jgi:hypothetical protein